MLAINLPIHNTHTYLEIGAQTVSRQFPIHIFVQLDLWIAYIATNEIQKAALFIWRLTLQTNTRIIVCSI